MFGLRCTKKLLKRLDVPKGAGAVVPYRTTTRLGDWVANVVVHDRRPLVIAASGLSLLPIVMPLAPAKTFVDRMPEAVAEMLTRVGIAVDDVRAERAEMNHLVVQPASAEDRVVLGSMNDFARLLDVWLDSSLVDAALRIADAPCSPIKMERPSDVARALFAITRLPS